MEVASTETPKMNGTSWRKYLALIQIKLLKNCQIFRLSFPKIYPDNKLFNPKPRKPGYSRFKLVLSPVKYKYFKTKN